MKKNLVLVGKTVAAVCSIAGVYFTATGQYQASSFAWNIAAMCLWLISLTA